MKVHEHEKSARMQKAAGSAQTCVCVCVYVRICSNHIHPRPSLRCVKLKHIDFHDAMEGKTARLLRRCGGRCFFLQWHADSWPLQANRWPAAAKHANPAAATWCRNPAAAADSLALLALASGCKQVRFKSPQHSHERAPASTSFYFKSNNNFSMWDQLTFGLFIARCKHVISCNKLKTTAFCSKSRWTFPPLIHVHVYVCVCVV